MAERTVTVGSRVGLHARPAAIFTQAVARQPVAVTIARPGQEPVDARSILLVLTLGIGPADQVVLRAEGEGAEAVLDDLAVLLAGDLDPVG